jgi:F0F1-type ATP synthase membrane subunit b/b'
METWFDVSLHNFVYFCLSGISFFILFFIVGFFRKQPILKVVDPKISVVKDANENVENDKIQCRLEELKNGIAENKKLYESILLKLEELDQRTSSNQNNILKKITEIDDATMEVKREIIFTKKSNQIKSRRNSSVEGNSIEPNGCSSLSNSRNRRVSLTLDTNFQDIATMYLSEKDITGKGSSTDPVLPVLESARFNPSSSSNEQKNTTSSLFNLPAASGSFKRPLTLTTDLSPNRIYPSVATQLFSPETDLTPRW